MCQCESTIYEEVGPAIEVVMKKQNDTEKDVRAFAEKLAQFDLQAQETVTLNQTLQGISKMIKVFLWCQFSRRNLLTDKNETRADGAHGLLSARLVLAGATGAELQCTTDARRGAKLCKPPERGSAMKGLEKWLVVRGGTLLFWGSLLIKELSAVDWPSSPVPLEKAKETFCQAYLVEVDPLDLPGESLDGVPICGFDQDDRGGGWLMAPLGVSPRELRESYSPWTLLEGDGGFDGYEPTVAAYAANQERWDEVPPLDLLEHGLSGVFALKAIEGAEDGYSVPLRAVSGPHAEVGDLGPFCPVGEPGTSPDERDAGPAGNDGNPPGTKGEALPDKVPGVLPEREEALRLTTLLKEEGCCSGEHWRGICCWASFESGDVDESPASGRYRFQRGVLGWSNREAISPAERGPGGQVCLSGGVKARGRRRKKVCDSSRGDIYLPGGWIAALPASGWSKTPKRGASPWWEVTLCCLEGVTLSLAEVGFRRLACLAEEALAGRWRWKSFVTPTRGDGCWLCAWVGASTLGMCGSNSPGAMVSGGLGPCFETEVWYAMEVSNSVVVESRLVDIPGGCVASNRALEAHAIAPWEFGGGGIESPYPSWEIGVRDCQSGGDKGVRFRVVWSLRRSPTVRKYRSVIHGAPRNALQHEVKVVRYNSMKMAAVEEVAYAYNLK
eukprot:s1246_g6.t1